jgi:hypothetical protein
MTYTTQLSDTICLESTKIIGYPGLLIPSYKAYSCELTWKPAARCCRWPHEGTGWFNPSPGWRSAQCQVILCADPSPHPHPCCSAPQHLAAVAGCSSGQEQPAPPRGCAAAATRETKRQSDKLRTSDMYDFYMIAVKMACLLAHA